MSKRSRRRARSSGPTAAAPHQLNAGPSPSGTQTRAPAPPEPLLLDQIAQGELDAHLTAIADAIYACRELLATINSAKALAMLNVGDRVRFNHHTRPPIPPRRRRRRDRARPPHRDSLHPSADRPVPRRRGPPLPTAAARPPAPRRLN